MQNKEVLNLRKKARIPVFMIGIDGADWKIVQRLVAEGKLPTLARLIQQGCYGELASPADEYAGGVWPDFYTGQTVTNHGIYHNKIWHPRHMRCEVPTDKWLSSRPFYELLSEQGYRVCVLDMPMVRPPPRPVNGIYLGGWGTHDFIAKGASPCGLWDQLKSEYGAPLMPAEHYGPQSAHSLLSLRDQLLKATEQMTRIGVKLLGSEHWDFGCIVLGATHRAGHYLWDHSQVENISEENRQKISMALEDVYIACDTALEKLLEVSPQEALKVAFAVHGMIPNHGWGDLGADLLEAILNASQPQKPKRGLLYQIRSRLPFQLVRPLLTRLPNVITDRLVQLWSARMYNWQTTQCFPVPMDQAGYIRINLKGREKNGIVELGADYNQLCEDIEQNFMSLKDVDSGRPIASRVIRAWSQAPEYTPERDVLPDLVVVWGDTLARETRSVISDRLPGFKFKVPDKNASGRSGNHIGRGWFAANGPNLTEHTQLEGYTIRDLAPTVFKAMAAFPSESLKGQGLPLISEAVNDH